MKWFIDVRARDYLSRIARRVRSQPTFNFAHDVFNPLDHHYPRRALLVFLAEPFLIRPNSRKFQYHQNYKQSLQIARVLVESGFNVDVLDYRDDAHIGRVAEPYDLLISHRPELSGFEGRLAQNTMKVYLASGMNHLAFNRQLTSRLQYLEMRRGCVLRDIQWNDENLMFPRIADAIIGFGNDDTVGTWREISDAPIYSFNNYGFRSIAPITRDFRESRTNFLFFGSRQQVLKGLDLLLDVFVANPDLNLYVCGQFREEGEFCRCYQKELFHSKNIYPVGSVRVDSAAFRDLGRKCAFVIHPSSSEGQPGSVVQCMHTGMIPIVTTQCGIDAHEFGVTLNESTVEVIGTTVRSMSRQGESELQRMAVRTREISVQKFSEEAFEHRWRDILAKIMEEIRHRAN